MGLCVFRTVFPVELLEGFTVFRTGETVRNVGVALRMLLRDELGFFVAGAIVRIGTACSDGVAVLGFTLIPDRLLDVEGGVVVYTPGPGDLTGGLVVTNGRTVLIVIGFTVKGLTVRGATVKPGLTVKGPLVVNGGKVVNGVGVKVGIPGVQGPLVADGIPVSVSVGRVKVGIPVNVNVGGRVKVGIPVKVNVGRVKGGIVVIVKVGRVKVG